jgi:transcriptional regulator NrdR family protein
MWQDGLTLGASEHAVRGAGAAGSPFDMKCPGLATSATKSSIRVKVWKATPFAGAGVLECSRRFTSYERPTKSIHGRRRTAGANGSNASWWAVCSRRAKSVISIPALEAIADKIEARLQDSPSEKFHRGNGATAAVALAQLDKVARPVRRCTATFRDLDEFKDELNALLMTRE